MEIEDRVTQHERSIGRIEGRLESLATKDFVRKEVNDAVKTIDAKIDTQTKDLSDMILNLRDQIEQERRWRMRVTGGVSMLALLLVSLSSFITILVSLGVIQP